MKLGPLIIDIPGYELTGDDKEVLNHPLVGGVILFSKNFLSNDQISLLIRDIHNATQDRELLITVDQEGGRVQRFKEGFSSLEAPGIIGNIINYFKIIYYLLLSILTALYPFQKLYLFKMINFTYRSLGRMLSPFLFKKIKFYKK